MNEMMMMNDRIGFIIIITEFGQEHAFRFFGA